MPYSLLIGDRIILDIENPRPEDIDITAIKPRLARIQRFSNDHRSLTVWQHVYLVVTLATHFGESEEVLDWCLHHDDHEAVIGDIPGPLKSLIGNHSDILRRVEARLDEAICMARGANIPSWQTRRAVHLYDKMAEAIEWTLHMGMPSEQWTAHVPLPVKVQWQFLEAAQRLELPTELS